MKFHQYLSEHYQLPEEILEDLNDSGQRNVFAKGEIILPTQNFSKNVYFVEKGLIKMFYYKEGRSITHYFLPENKFITQSENFSDHNSAYENVEYGLASLENQTTIFQIPFSKIKHWTDTSVEMNKFIQQILLDVLKNFSDKLNNIQFGNAQERYENLLKNNPEIILRAPLGDIASYLGISQQTLSVIRAQVK